MDLIRIIEEFQKTESKKEKEEYFLKFINTQISFYDNMSVDNIIEHVVKIEVESHYFPKEHFEDLKNVCYEKIYIKMGELDVKGRVDENIISYFFSYIPPNIGSCIGKIRNYIFEWNEVERIDGEYVYYPKISLDLCSNIDDRHKNPESILIQEENLEELEEVISSTLSSKELYIFNENVLGEKRQIEIAKELGVSQPRISCVKNRTIRKLRRTLGNDEDIKILYQKSA